MELISDESKDSVVLGNKLWLDYVESNSRIFRELAAIKKIGWESPMGDQFFARQRKNADYASRRVRKVFFNMMRQIGDEMQTTTGALKLPGNDPLVLDLCMAPGGYTTSVLKYNPKARVDAITLPEASGGHEIFVRYGDKDPRVRVVFADITMLTGELGLHDIPAGHSDAANFVLDQRILGGRHYDLVFCDGQVLRNHQRAAYREGVEATRLVVSQLIIALRRVRQGGTIIVLLHKVDNWNSASLLFTFSKFARVKLFKPQFRHAKRSSFYLIVQNINRESSQAQSALIAWEDEWQKATFGPMDALRRWPSDEDVKALIAHFGPQYIEMAETIWEIQRCALAQAGFTSMPGCIPA